jgi:hypothetical protein
VRALAASSKEEDVMIAKWKSLVVVSIVLAAIAWLGPHNDSGSVDLAQQVSAIATGCGAPSGRCMVDVRYTYPAADLSIVADDAYF